MSLPLLTSIQIGAGNVGQAAEFLAQVTGSSAIIASEGVNVTIPIGGTSLVIHPIEENARAGITGISFSFNEERKLPRLNNLNVVSDLKAPVSTDSSSVAADVALDHIAVVAADLEASVAAWVATLGVEPEFVGIHPVSSGTLRVARFCLGDQMIELLTPVAGQPSAIDDRLNKLGEGPFAIALPAKKLEEKRRALGQLGVRLIWNDPHWLIHPKNPANTLIQLTPRVEH